MTLDVERQELLEPEVRRAGTHALVLLSGELDISTVPKLYEQFAQLAHEGVSHVSIDLSRLTFVDSTGLSLLVTEHKRAKALGGELILFSPQPHVRRIIEVTGLEAVLTILPAKDDYIPPVETAAPAGEGVSD